MPKIKKENKSLQNEEVVTRLHEIYWIICSDLEAIISK